MSDLIYLEKELENCDVLIIVLPEKGLYRVSAYSWDLDTRECTKHEFAPEDFDIALEIVAHFVGRDVDIIAGQL